MYANIISMVGLDNQVVKCNACDLACIVYMRERERERERARARKSECVCVCV